MNQIPVEAQEALKQLAREQERKSTAKRVFIAIPNMNELCVGLVSKLFKFAMQRKYDPWFHFITEKRHTDFARNQIVHAFLESECDVLCMIDADVDPDDTFLELIDLDKDIMSANVFCWIRGDLMASIWQRSECEQCRCLNIWLSSGKIHDPSQYKEMTDLNKQKYLYRWNPFASEYQKFATKGGILKGQKCRCMGTGLDPFVFKSHKGIKDKPLQVDSVGSAAMLIQKRVITNMPFPWFRFLYRESGEILLTEDHYFCWKAQECGFEVWAAPKMFSHHYKTIDLMRV